LYVHWNEAEAREHVAELAAGHAVRHHASTVDHPRMGDRMPEALVISPDRPVARKADSGLV
jgi:hypothetical protein